VFGVYRSSREAWSKSLHGGNYSGGFYEQERSTSGGDSHRIGDSCNKRPHPGAAVCIGARLPPAVQEHIYAARLLAGNDLPKTLIPNLLTTLPSKARAERNTNKKVGPPMKAFDQLYFFGLGSVCSWALVTSDGIIQIDTLDNSDEARNIIEAGYRGPGLD
jgi:hypothetical protein